MEAIPSSQRSEAQQPECFPPEQVRLQKIAIFVDYKLDESYTPQRISIRAGSSFHDLKEIRSMDVSEPKGWIVVYMRPPNPL